MTKNFKKEHEDRRREISVVRILTVQNKYWEKLENGATLCDIRLFHSGITCQTSFLPLGATAEGELCPPEQSAFILLCSEADCLVSEHFSFYGVRLLASPLDLSGTGDPTSSYTTTGIALRVSGALKPHHYCKVETPSVENLPDYTA
jgi:hypothetical protein